MKRLGWILLTIAFATALLSTIVERENRFLLAILGIAILFGSLLLLIDGGIRLYRGELKLRPLDAAKKAFLLFTIILGLRLFAWVLFPSIDRDLIEAVLVSAVFAVFYSVYVTAYRKPAS